jgi:hypothetical protein
VAYHQEQAKKKSKPICKSLSTLFSALHISVGIKEGENLKTEN